MNEHAAPHAAGTDPAPSTEDRLAEIRARCTEPEPPGPCPVCGAPREIGASGGGETKWACYVKRPGHGRDLEHYDRSIVIQRWPSPDTVYLLALVDALTVENAEYRAAMQALLTHYRRHTEHRCEIERDAAGLLAAESVDRGAAILAAGDEMATWLAAWVAENPEACYSIAALNRWRALVPARPPVPDHAYHSTATPHCGTVAGEGKS